MKRKIKLKDMTSEQWKRFKKNDCYNNIMECENCPLKYVNCSYSDEDKELWINHKDLYSDKLLDYEIEIEMPDILNEQEKEYLRAVIKPFRDRVISIRKNFDVFKDAYSIFIYIKSTMEIGKVESIGLPFFKNNMYMGMEHTTNYTLEELGL